MLPELSIREPDGTVMGWTVGDRCLAWENFFCTTQHSAWLWGPSSLLANTSGGRGVKRLKQEADHSPLSSVDGNGGAIPPIPHVFMELLWPFPYIYIYIRSRKPRIPV
jgi:hypothetical protein